MKCLHQYGTVFLSGREGTGKSKMCLQLASLCEKMDYLPYLVDLSKDPLEYFGSSKILYIIDCNEYDSLGTEQFRNLLNHILCQDQVWLIFTCRKTDFTNVPTILPKNNLLKGDNLIDLNNSLTKEEKQHILKENMKANNIAESSSEEANFHMKEVLENKEILVKIDAETIQEIIKTEPFYGFPLTTVKFCKDRQLLHLGKAYFTTLPESLENEIWRLAEIDRKETTQSALVGMRKYCILAYIATDGKKILETRDINIQRFRELLMVLYHTTDRDIDIKIMVKDAIKSLDQFLIANGGRYTFAHPYVLATVYKSHDYFTKYLIEEGTFSEIKEFIRSSKYQRKYGEIVCIIDDSRYVVLCKRLVTVACIDEENLKDVGMYIYEQFIKLEDSVFRDILITLLVYRMHCEKHPSPTTDKVFTTRDVEIPKRDTGPQISFWKTVLLMDEFSDHGNISWVLLRENDLPSDYRIEQHRSHPLEIPDIILLCGVITTCFEKRQGTMYKEKLLQQFRSKLRHEHQPFLQTLIQKVDIYGNTFFHYLAVLSDENSCFILEVSGDVLKKENRSKFGQSNKMYFTPLDMTAYLGKLKLFTLLLDKTKQSYIDKNRVRLLELTEEGRRYRYHNTKGFTEGKQDSRMSLNFGEELLRYIQYGKEKDFLDILTYIKRLVSRRKM